MPSMGSILDMLTNKIVNLKDPTAAQDAATKAYVDKFGGMLVQSGQVTIPTNAVNIVASIVVTFPVPYTAAPYVVVSPHNNNPAIFFVSTGSSWDRTQVTIYGVRTTGTASFSCNWIAAGAP